MTNSTQERRFLSELKKLDGHFWASFAQNPQGKWSRVADMLKTNQVHLGAAAKREFSDVVLKVLHAVISKESLSTEFMLQVVRVVEKVPTDNAAIASAVNDLKTKIVSDSKAPISVSNLKLAGTLQDEEALREVYKALAYPDTPQVKCDPKVIRDLKAKLKSLDLELQKAIDEISSLSPENLAALNDRLSVMKRSVILKKHFQKPSLLSEKSNVTVEKLKSLLCTGIYIVIMDAMKQISKGLSSDQAELICKNPLALMLFENAVQTVWSKLQRCVPEWKDEFSRTFQFLFYQKSGAKIFAFESKLISDYLGGRILLFQWQIKSSECEKDLTGTLRFGNAENAYQNALLGGKVEGTQLPFVYLRKGGEALRVVWSQYLIEYHFSDEERRTPPFPDEERNAQLKRPLESKNVSINPFEVLREISSDFPPMMAIASDWAHSLLKQADARLKAVMSLNSFNEELKWDIFDKEMTEFFPFVARSMPIMSDFPDIPPPDDKKIEKKVLDDLTISQQQMCECTLYLNQLVELASQIKAPANHDLFLIHLRAVISQYARLIVDVRFMIRPNNKFRHLIRRGIESLFKLALNSQEATTFDRFFIVHFCYGVAHNPEIIKSSSSFFGNVRSAWLQQITDLVKRPEVATNVLHPFGWPIGLQLMSTPNEDLQEGAVAKGIRAMAFVERLVDAQRTGSPGEWLLKSGGRGAVDFSLINEVKNQGFGGGCLSVSEPKSKEFPDLTHELAHAIVCGAPLASAFSELYLLTVECEFQEREFSEWVSHARLTENLIAFAFLKNTPKIYESSCKILTSSPQILEFALLFFKSILTSYSLLKSDVKSNSLSLFAMALKKSIVAAIKDGGLKAQRLFPESRVESAFNELHVLLNKNHLGETHLSDIFTRCSRIFGFQRRDYSIEDKLNFALLCENSVTASVDSARNYSKVEGLNA